MNNLLYRSCFFLYILVVFGCTSGSNITVDYLNDKYTNDQSEFSTIEDVHIDYRDEGSGPPLILLHGIGSSLHTWDGWTERLKNDFRVIRLDLPGFGLTGADSTNNYSMERYISILHSFLGSLNISTCYMAGNSLGGWLAWEYTLDHPDEVKKLILIDAAGFITPDNPPKPLRLSQKFKKRTTKGAPKFAVRKFLKQAYGDKNKVTDELIDRYYQLNNRPGNGLAFYTIATSNYNPRTSKLPKIEVPTLIMWGAEDKKWIDVSHAHLFEELLPNNQLIIYEGLGHLPMEEAPQRTANDASEFLAN